MALHKTSLQHISWLRSCIPTWLRSHSFLCGELVLTCDPNGRKHLFTLQEGAEVNLLQGKVRHSDVIGSTPGGTFPTTLGVKLTIRRPSLEEYVTLMRRGPTPTYPKDITAMLSMMDIGVGSKVMEGGSGSGAMTLYLSRAGESLVLPRSSHGKLN